MIHMKLSTEPPLGKKASCLLALAFLTHLSLPSILLAPALILLLLSHPSSLLASPRPFTDKYWQGMRVAVEFVAYIVALYVASVIASGNTTWVARTWGAR